MIYSKTVELCLGGPYDGQRSKVPTNVFMCLFQRDADSCYMYSDVGMVEGKDERVWSDDGKAQLFKFVGVVHDKQPSEKGKG